MLKKFTNYYNIWNVINEWILNFPKWMRDPWIEINSLKAEKFVDEGLKTFNQSIKQVKNF